jgi:hypothetical protein
MYSFLGEFHEASFLMNTFFSYFFIYILFLFLSNISWRLHVLVLIQFLPRFFFFAHCNNRSLNFLSCFMSVHLFFFPYFSCRFFVSFLLHIFKFIPPTGALSAIGKLHLISKWNVFHLAKK